MSGVDLDCALILGRIPADIWVDEVLQMTKLFGIFPFATLILHGPY